MAPTWMKENGEYSNGPLKESMYQVWADYHLKFIEAYDKENITFWAISGANEPRTGTIFSANVPLVAWTSAQMVSV